MNALLDIISNTYWILFQLAIVLISTKVLGILMKKIGLPQVLGALLAGVLLGLINLGLSKIGDGKLYLIDGSNQAIITLANIGVNFIMFSAGMETNFREIKKNGWASIIITLLGVAVPLLIGFAVSWILPDRMFNPDIDIIKQRFFFGAILTATSVGITVAVLKELNVLHGKVGASIVTAAILDDIIGIIILAIFTAKTDKFSVGKAFIQLFTDTPNALGVTILNILLFFIVAVALGVLAHILFKKISEKKPGTRRLTIYAISLCFIFAAIAESLFGVAAITGSFVAGMMIANMKESHYVERRMDMSGYMMFSPLFFANIGISLNYNQIGKMFSSGDAVFIVLFCLAFVIFGMVAKLVGCGFGAKMFKYNWQESLKVGIGMMVRGEVCLIFANTGKDAGLISEEYYPAIILLIIVSSILTPLLLKTLYKKFPMQEPHAPLSADGVHITQDGDTASAVAENDNTDNVANTESSSSVEEDIK